MEKSRILVLTAENRNAVLGMSKIEGYDRVIVVSLKSEDTEFLFNAVQKLTESFVSKIDFHPNIDSVASAVRSKVGSQEPNPVFYFTTASGSEKELRAARALKLAVDELSTTAFADVGKVMP